ncbi:MAG TPA: hypothetical protein VK617_08480 [Gemmatimonadaceae bacterium]|nr:hypothetical protein [Gemmatimonadaceae bacterium]
MHASRALVLALSGIALAAAAVLWCAHPICVRLSPAEVAEAARWAPLETRTDRQWHGRVFQRRDGQWCQCKSWISREFFF